MLLSLAGYGQAGAQIVSDAVKWTYSMEKKSDTERVLVFKASIGSGWHMYSTSIPEGGPQPTTLLVDKISGAQLVGKLYSPVTPIEKFDNMFEMQIGYFEGRAELRQKIKLTDPEKFRFEGAVRYMVCNDQQCLPPTSYEVSLGVKDLGELPKAKEAKPVATPAEQPTEAAKPEVESTNEESEGQAPTDSLAVFPTNGDAATPTASGDDLWRPAIDELKAFGDKTYAEANSSLLMILLYGFLGGLIALMTPCVWPMIPMTVSFFLKRTKDRSKSIRDAITYGVSIIVIYLILGLVVTGLFGPAALNNLATNAVFNIVFFLLLVFFAISFFGAFELVLPASWTNKIDQKADSSSGLLSIFFMAFTLALVSFSCTGPIVGTLLVQAASMGDLLGPAVGMFGFALALALPFALFAIFPSMLQSMPKSGGWLNSVKVVLAFLELALSLKFLSVADLAYGWGILDRETFLALWIVIFTLLGFYLIGKINFPHDTPSERTSIPGLFLGLISLSFSVYMIPGLWGAPLRSISAFAPPLTTQDFNLYEGGVHAKFDDYEVGMEYARKKGKPVLVDFSGFGCVNCRKMEASVWIDPRVKGILENDYVLITLMVDDKTSLPEVIEVEENGSRVKLRTVGDKWSYLQRHKFGANAQPFYVALDHAGRPLTTSRAYNEDISAYIEWLQSGIKQFKAQSEAIHQQ
ncbi:MAG: cytochrome c biogenesis protein CcdA [Porphyromonadaceae bacterium]|nr:cytochrome c biogenesis protein CcdA [Porphyromonadaceae bacterium]